jgi:hypothetical protein
MTFLKLLGATAIGVVYVWLNISLMRLLHSARTVHWLRLRWRYGRRLVNRQVEMLGKGAWFYAAPQFACLLLAGYAARTEMSPLLLGFVLVAVLLANVHVILLAIFRITAVGQWWASPATKFFVYSVPLLLAYEGRLAGASWVADLFRMSAANFPLAWGAAALFVVLAFVGVLLVALAFVIELAMLVAMFANHGMNSIKSGLLPLFALTFVNLYAQSQIASKYSANPLGGLLLSAIAFEFDAVPIDRCEIPSDELSDASEQGWLIKVVPLASSQEKAVIVRQRLTRVSNVMLARLDNDQVDQRKVVIGRVVACFK